MIYNSKNYVIFNNNKNCIVNNNNKIVINIYNNKFQSIEMAECAVIINSKK